MLTSRMFFGVAGRWLRQRRWLACIALTFTAYATATVSAAGSATLSWEPPSERTDGSPLTDLTSYRAYWNCGGGIGYPSSVTFPATVTSYVLDGLPDGATCRFVLAAVDSKGIQSAYSNEATKVIPIVPVADPTVGPQISWRKTVMATNVYENIVSSSSLNSGTLEPVADRRYMLAVAAYRGDSTNPPTPSVSLWGLTWSLVGSAVYDNSSSSRRAVWVYSAVTGESPSSGALTVSVTGAGYVGAVLDVLDVVGTIVQSDVEFDTGDTVDEMTAELASEAGANSVMWAAFSSGFYPPVSEEIETQEFEVLGEAVEPDEVGVQTAYSAEPVSSITWTVASVRPMAAILVEIDTTSSVPVEVVNVYEDDTSGSTLTSGTLNPVANRFYMLTIGAYRDSADPGLPTTVSLWGLTWTLRGNGVFDNSSSSRRAFYVYTAVTGESPSSGALTVTITSAAFVVAALDMVDAEIDGEVVQSKTALNTGEPNSLTCTLDTPADSGSFMLTAFGWGGYDFESVAPSGFLRVGNAEVTDEIGVETAYLPSNADSATWSVIDTQGPMGVVLIEVRRGTEGPTDPVVSFAVVGGVTATGATIKARITSNAGPDLLVSESSDLSNPVDEVEPVATADSVYQFDISGLSANTVYYYGFVESIGSFRTAPSGLANFKVAFGSCSRLQSNAATWLRIRDQAPAFFFHMGDYGYSNIDENDVTRFYSTYKGNFTRANQKSLYQTTPLVYMFDDHDYGPNDSDGSSVSRPAALQAYREYVPHYPLVHDSDPDDDPIYHTFVWGGVRFAICDTRSESDVLGEEPGDGEILGATQLAWLLNLIETFEEPALVIHVGVPWVVHDFDEFFLQHWGHASAEREAISDAIQQYAKGRVLLIHGDSHMLAADDGTNTNFADDPDGLGPPLFAAAPLDENPSVKGGPYSEGTYIESQTQYGVISFEWSGTQVTATYQGYDVDGSSETGVISLEVTLNESQEADTAEGAEFAADFTPVAHRIASISAGVEVGGTFSGRAEALAGIVEAIEAGDTDAAANAAQAAVLAQVQTDAQYAALAQAAAAIAAGLEAGEEWASVAAAEAGLTAGVSLGVSFVGETQASQSAAIQAGTEASASFLGAVAAFALLEAGATAGDAFAASASISESVTGAAQFGASFVVSTGDSRSISAAAALEDAFLSAVSGVASVTSHVDVEDAFEAIGVALAAINAGISLGATFSAASSADVSIVGATASVRAIRRMGASVRAI